MADWDWKKKPGKIQVEWGDTSFNSKYYNPEVYLRWTDQWTGEELNILFMNREQAKNLIDLLQKTIKNMDEYEERIQKIISETDFTKLYAEFERKYNPYPVQMSREEAFRNALFEHLIDSDTYDAAKRYYKGLWNYVGD